MALFARIKQPFVVLRVMSVMKPRRQAKIGEFDMSVLVNEDIVRFDVTVNDQYASSLNISRTRLTDE